MQVCIRTDPGCFASHLADAVLDLRSTAMARNLYLVERDRYEYIGGYALKWQLLHQFCGYWTGGGYLVVLTDVDSVLEAQHIIASARPDIQILVRN